MLLANRMMIRRAGEQEEILSAPNLNPLLYILIFFVIWILMLSIIIIIEKRLHKKVISYH